MLHVVHNNNLQDTSSSWVARRIPSRGFPGVNRKQESSDSNLAAYINNLKVDFCGHAKLMKLELFGEDVLTEGEEGGN